MRLGDDIVRDTFSENISEFFEYFFLPIPDSQLLKHGVPIKSQEHIIKSNDTALFGGPY